MGRMWQEGGVPEEEWFRFRASMMDEISDWLHPRTTNLQATIAMSPARFGKSTRHAVSEVAVLKTAFPPLATLVTQVPAFAQQLRERLELFDVRDQLGSALLEQIGISFGILGRRIIARDSVAMCVMPRD